MINRIVRAMRLPSTLTILEHTNAHTHTTPHPYNICSASGGVRPPPVSVCTAIRIVLFDNREQHEYTIDAGARARGRAYL